MNNVVGHAFKRSACGILAASSLVWPASKYV
jgi:hypothetical protein